MKTANPDSSSESEDEESKMDFDEPHMSAKTLIHQTQMKTEVKQIKRKAVNRFFDDKDPKIYGISLSLFSQKSKFRQLCFKIVTNPKFDYAIIFVIIVSGIQLALENPLNDPKGMLISVLTYIDIGTTAIFAVEALMKIITFGLIFNGKTSYLRKTWNILDFCIIIFSILSLTPYLDNLRIFKMFRVVRSLRLVSKNEGLQLAVKALMSAIPQLANVLLIMILFYIIFSIIAISYFKGKYFYCMSS